MKINVPLAVNPAPHNQSGTNRYGGVFKSKREVAYINDLTKNIKDLDISEHYKDQPLTIKYTFGIKPPKSWTNKKTKQALEHKLYPTAHNVGDIDNLTKSTQDILMSANIIDDDSNIVQLIATKVYALEPFVTIEVTNYEQEYWGY